jgi:hypothetical protein
MMEQALADPIASTHVLDEGDDLTTNFWSDLAQELRRFFRKCGQLNQFLILILPDFFELPTPFALNYSQCLINVHFKGAFERGYYDFYGPERKKNLYLMGKKMKDYSCVAPDFSGDFINLYTVGEEAYRKKKKEDLQNDQAKDTTSPIASTYKRRVALQILERVEKGIVENLKPLQKTQLLDVCVSTVKEYNRELRLNDYFGIEKYQNAGELEPKGLTIAQYPLKKSILPDGNGARMEENEINVS